MKRVLITGATGFIGRHCLRPLIERGFEVHALSRTPPKDSPNVSWHRLDLGRHSDMAPLLQSIRPQYLLHLAWTVEHGEFWESPANLDCLANSLQLLRSFSACGGERAIFAGTCAEYEWNEEECVEGVSRLRPASLYGACKNALREVVEIFANNTGLSWAWGRAFLVYGPGENQKRFVASMITSMLRGSKVQCHTADHVRDLLHVADLASLFVALLDSELQGAVNLASGQPVSLGSVATAIASKIGDPSLLDLQYVDSVPFSLTASVERLRPLDWKPRFTMDSGLDDTIRWWKDRFADGRATRA